MKDGGRCAIRTRPLVSEIDNCRNNFNDLGNLTCQIISNLDELCKQNAPYMHPKYVTRPLIELMGEGSYITRSLPCFIEKILNCYVLFLFILDSARNRLKSQTNTMARVRKSSLVEIWGSEGHMWSNRCAETPMSMCDGKFQKAEDIDRVNAVLRVAGAVEQAQVRDHEPEHRGRKGLVI